MTEKDMLALLAANGLPEDALMAERLCGYLAMLLDWNGRVDLIAPTDEAEAADRHLMDSLTILNAPGLMPAGRVIDVGTGAGLPGLVLAIARPEQPFTLVDALRKRVDFLNAVVEKLGLRRVTVLHARAEDAARMAEHREDLSAVMIGVGGLLDVLAGDLPRAPEAWRRAGLEWLFRLLRQPWRAKRMAKLPRVLLLAAEERIKNGAPKGSAMDR